MEEKNQSVNNVDNSYEEDEVKTNKKNRKSWLENECPKGRWLVALFLGYVVASFLIYFNEMYLVPKLCEAFSENKPLITFAGTIFDFGFILFFTLIFIKVICRTSVASFVLGRDHNLEKKEMWHIAGLFLLGFFLSYLVIAPNIYLNPEAEVSKVLCLLLVALLFTWMQTTLEEVWFRGIIGRMFFKDNLKQKLSVKVVVFIAVSSILFAAGHVWNPEVLTQSGLEVVFMISAYLFTGIMFAVIDIIYGNLVPGMIVHYINNVACFVFIRAEVSVIETQTIFIDGTKNYVGLFSFIQIVVEFIPIIIYLVIRQKMSGLRRS